jgi:hypothetical protein
MLRAPIAPLGAGLSAEERIVSGVGGVTVQLELPAFMVQVNSSTLAFVSLVSMNCAVLVRFEVAVTVMV